MKLDRVQFQGEEKVLKTKNFLSKTSNGVKEKLIGLRENVPLADCTTFKIGGPAKYFFEAKNEKELIGAIKTAKQFKLPFFIIGGGSNILIADEGYEGLVIRIKNLEYRVKDSEILAEAGVKLALLIKVLIDKDSTGLEWAVGIPGTVGAAVYGNIGAFGSSMADNIQSVKVLDVKNLKIETFSNKKCNFNNKDSIFKRNKNRIILSVALKVKKGDKEEIEKKIKRFSDYRKKNHPLNFPSAGCIFKNYAQKIKNKNLLQKFPELNEFNKGGIIPASYLIDKCGLKGKVAGKAKISEKHANFIINLGGAKTKDVVRLIKIIKKKVKEKFGIQLEEEIQYLQNKF